MRILGIDPGARVTGYGLIDVERNQTHAVKWGIFRAASTAPLAMRLKVICEGLSEFLVQHTPDVCVIESLFFARNARTALLLGHARGALLLSVARAGISVAEYSPLEVKQAVAGYGRAEKEQVRRMVIRLLAIRGTPLPCTDAADALAVALCHAHTMGNARVLTK